MSIERVDELRYIPEIVEDRSAGSLRRIGGLGVPYGKKSRLLPGGFREVVETRALAKSLADHVNVVSRLEHQPQWLLGTTDSGTMRLTDDPNVGTYYEVDLPDTSAGNDTYALTKRGDLKHASMGFQAFEQEWDREGTVPIRHLTSIRLIEISPVSQPAYADTHTALRGLAFQFGEDPEEVLELANRGELRALFTRTDQAPPPVVTLPPSLAQRNPLQDNGIDPMVAKRQLDLLARQPGHEIQANPLRASLELMRKRGDWYRDAEPEQFRRWSTEVVHVEAARARLD